MGRGLSGGGADPLFRSDLPAPFENLSIIYFFAYVSSSPELYPQGHINTQEICQKL
jgi:hypothetical protein